MKKTLVIAAIAFGLAGCAGARTDEQYDQLVQQAENEIKVAAQMKHLWKDTENFLKKSKEAKEAGDMDKAMKLVKKALKQAQVAQQQARDNANPAVFYP